MKKLVVLFCLVFVFLSGCNSVASTPIVSIPTAVPTVVPTVEITPFFVPTLESKEYTKFYFNQRYDGSIEMEWTKTEEKNPFYSWNRATEEFEEIKSVCKGISYSQTDGRLFIKGEIAEKDCISAVLKVSGVALSIPKTAERTVNCDGECEILDEATINRLTYSLKTTDVIITKDAKNYFRVNKKASRLDGNIYGWSGFGVKNVFPETVSLKDGGIESMGVNWDQKSLCYNQPIALGSETGVYLPGDRTCTNNFDGIIFSYGVVDNLYIFWTFVPRIENKIIYLHVIDVVIIKFESIETPDFDLEEPIFSETSTLVDGEKVDVVGYYYAYYQIHDQQWQAWIKDEKGVYIVKEGQMFAFEADLILQEYEGWFGKLGLKGEMYIHKNNSGSIYLTYSK